MKIGNESLKCIQQENGKLFQEKRQLEQDKDKLENRTVLREISLLKTQKESNRRLEKLTQKEIVLSKRNQELVQEKQVLEKSKKAIRKMINTLSGIMMTKELDSTKGMSYSQVYPSYSS